MKNKLENYGFVEEDVEITEQDYTFGSSLPRTTIQPNGNWEPYLPEFEPQASKYETWSCTSYGGANQIETYMKKVFGSDYNYSDRYNANLAEIKSPGTTPTKTYETFRKKGLIPDAQLPYPNTYEEFITPRPMEQKHIDNGKIWLEQYDYKHEWVKSNDMHAIIKHALRYSPIAISVSAWYEQGGMYVDMGVPNNHWCLCFKFDGNSPVVFDSYDSSIKKLHPDHKIKYAKRILITKKAKPSLVKRRRWWSDFNLLRTWKIRLHT